MAITAASVEANGWVLRLTVTAAPGNFASYALDPDGAARVSLACSHAGFVPAGGVAAPGVWTRTIVATKPLRKPVNPASPTTPVIDETDNGDGTVTVRLALSEYVHATETSVALTVAAGWRTGAGAQAPAVTNASTFVAPLPIFRWTDVPYQRRTGSFPLELIAFSHHPNHVAPLAAVKFTVTDGTTVKTAWTTAMTTSNLYGDAVRVYGVTIDPAGLTAGLLRCDAEIYPWLGLMRSTDGLGTRSMAALDIAGYGAAAATPFVVGYDPVGTRYAGAVLFIDPAGTVTPSAAMVQPDLASAKALSVGTRPRDVSTAVQALSLSLRTLPAANGQAPRSRSCDGARLVLASGIHAGVGITAVTSGTTSAEMPVVIEGDPDLPDPRTAVVLRTGTASGLRTTKMLLRNLTLEVGTTALTATSSLYWWLDNLEIRGKAGQETQNTPPFVGAAPTGKTNLFGTRLRYWRAGSKLSGAGMRFVLLRACEFSRRVDAHCVIGGRFIGASEDGTHSDAEGGIGGFDAITDIAQAEDIVVAGNDLRSVRGRAWLPASIPAASAGTLNPSLRRLVFAGNQCERIATGNPFWSMGEDVLATMSYNIVEGNSFVGERCNIMYSDPIPINAGDVDVALNQAFGNRIANNSFDWAATKHDAFNDSHTSVLRGGTNGYRPHMTATWSVTYGVNFEANIDYGRHGSAGNFAFEYFGRRSIQMLVGVPNWPDDRSGFGTGTGGGSYRPPAGSLLAGRARRSSLDRDRTGLPRSATFASGASDVLSALSVALAPVQARSAMRSLSPLLAWRGVLTPTSARSRVRSGSALLGWAGGLLPASARLAHRARAAAIGWSATVVATRARHRLRGGSPLVALDALSLGPVGARHVLRDAGVAILPDLLFATPRLMRIGGELRLQIVEPNRFVIVN